MKQKLILCISVLFLFVAVACSKQEGTMNTESNTNGTKENTTTNQDNGKNDTNNEDSAVSLPNIFGYVYDGELYLYNDGTTKKITRNMRSENTSYNNQFVITKDLTKLVYYDCFNFNDTLGDGTVELHMMDLNSYNELTIADDVIDFKVNDDASLVFILTNSGKLQVYNHTEILDISDNVREFTLSSSGAEIIYLTESGSLMTYKYGENSQSIASGDVYSYKYSEDLDVIVFSKNDLLYYKKRNSSPIELGKVESSRFYLTDTNALYYVMQEDIPFSEFIIDDMQGSSSEYSQTIRNLMATETFPKYSLYYYENGQKKMLADWVMDSQGLVKTYDFTNNSNIMAFECIGSQNKPQLKLSELGSSTVRSLRKKICSKAFEERCSVKLVVNGEVYESFVYEAPNLETMPHILKLGYNEADNKVYYQLRDENFVYKLYSQSIVNGIAQRVELLDYDKPYGFLIADGKFVGANFKKIVDVDALYDVYIDNVKILTEANIGYIPGAGTTLLVNLKMLNDIMLISEYGKPEITSTDSSITVERPKYNLKYYNGTDTILISDKLKPMYSYGMYSNNTLLPNGNVAYLTVEEDGSYNLNIFDGTSSKVLQENVTQLIEVLIDKDGKTAYALEGGEYMYGVMN